MKQILYILVFALSLSGINSSCKKNSLDTLHQNEVMALAKYVKDHKLDKYKDVVSGIYFKPLVSSGDTTKIRSGFKVMLQFSTFLIDSTKVQALTTEDQNGYTFNEYPFYVDVSNTVINENYVQQIAGMHLGLKKMHVGDRAFMVIPSELAFKAVDYSLNLNIPRFSTLLVIVYAKKGYAAGKY